MYLSIDELIQTAERHFRGNNLTEANRLCTQVLGRDPRSAEALHLRGLILQHGGQNAQAVEFFQQAISINSNAVGYHNNLGVVLQNLGRFEEAVAAYRRALEIKPNLIHVRRNLSRVLKAIGSSKEGLVMAHRPSPSDDADACNDRGISFYHRGDLQQSLIAFRQAVTLRPSLAAAWNNMGNVLRYQGELEQAIASYRRAISIRVDYPDAHQGLGMALLQMGDFANGWLEYEWRWKVSTAQPRRFRQPRWCGEDPVGKTIFIHEEQGYGDAIQFFRYASLLAMRGARVIVGCRPALARLLGELPGVSQVIVAGQTLPAFDLHCPIMSLPLLFDTRLETVPAKVPYFNVAPDRVAHWTDRLGLDKDLKVGLAWAGNPELGTNRIRSIGFEDASALAGIANVAFHSLQITPVAASGEPLPLTIRDHSSLLTDFSETAALIASLDLVISVDTAVAHLAGAMGRPTWILLPAAADWRWMMSRDDSPWYPTARLFRQTLSGDWKDVIERVTDRLAEVSRKFG